LIYYRILHNDVLDHWGGVDAIVASQALAITVTDDCG
jgi:hypothetical protein